MTTYRAWEMELLCKKSQNFKMCSLDPFASGRQYSKLFDQFGPLRAQCLSSMT